jgi:hypothetical protein
MYSLCFKWIQKQNYHYHRHHIKRMRWGAGCGTQGEEQNCILGFMGKPEERHCLEGTGKKVIILRWRFKKQDGIGRSTFLWLWRGTSGGVVTEWYGVICHHLAVERYKWWGRNRMVWGGMRSAGCGGVEVRGAQEGGRMLKEKSWRWGGTSDGVVTEWYGVIRHHLAVERYK